MTSITLYALHMDTDDGFENFVFLDRQSAVDHRAMTLTGLNRALPDVHRDDDFTTDGTNITRITEHTLEVPAPVSYVLVVRHPDQANLFTVDGPVVTVGIDLGTGFDSTPGDDEEALSFVDGLATSLAVLPATSPLLGAALDVYADIVKGFSAASAVVEAYRAGRRGGPRLMWAPHTTSGNVLAETGICSTCLTGTAAVTDLLDVASRHDDYDQSKELHDATQESWVVCCVCGFHRGGVSTTPDSFLDRKA